jgi:hypothetical protein
MNTSADEWQRRRRRGGVQGRGRGDVRNCRLESVNFCGMEMGGGGRWLVAAGSVVFGRWS